MAWFRFLDVKYLSSFKRYIFLIYFNTPFYRRQVDKNLKFALEIQWLSVHNKNINWDNPVTLNEKIQWLELNTDTTLWTKYADKYEVRGHLQELGLGEYLPKFFGVWNFPDDIDYDKLPDKFVLKCTHDSQSTLPIEKNNINVNVINRKFKKYLKRRFGYSTCEPHYTRIKPRIIAEEWLENTNSEISNSIIDYKVWCFNGEPTYIMTIHGRDKEHMMIDLFDKDWKRYSEYLNFSKHYRNGGGIVPRPSSLNEMLRVASVLSKGFPQVRIDFYDVNGKPYFGEMTFTSGCGRMNYFTDEAQLKMSELIKLPLMNCEL